MKGRLGFALGIPPPLTNPPSSATCLLSSVFPIVVQNLMNGAEIGFYYTQLVCVTFRVLDFKHLKTFAGWHFHSAWSVLCDTSVIQISSEICRKGGPQQFQLILYRTGIRAESVAQFLS
jgi:hypothetical protein